MYNEFLDQHSIMNFFHNFVENLTPEIELIEETAEEGAVELLPAKSRKIYEKQYEEFSKWCNNKNVEEYTEHILLEYFIEKSNFVKASTLWSQYSMLKAMLVVKNDIDISKFATLLAFLKKKNDGYKPNVTKTLTAEQVDQFLTVAPDNEFLMAKVALILGIAGACRGDELVNLSTKDVNDLGSSILFTIKKSKTSIDRRFIVTNSEENSVDFVELCKKYMSLRKKHTEHSRFFVQFKNNECTVQPVGKNTFGKLPQKIALFLDLPDASLYKGHCFRRTSASLLANTGVNINLLRRLKKATTIADGLAKLRAEKVKSSDSEPIPSTSTALSEEFDVKTSDLAIEHVDVGSISAPSEDVTDNEVTDFLPESDELPALPRQKRPRYVPPKEVKIYCRLCLNPVTKNQMVCLGDFHDLNYQNRTVQFKRNKILQTEMYLRMIRMIMPNFDHELVYNPIMCSDCSSRLQMASDFVEQCMATQKLIQQYKDTYNPTEKMVSCEDVVQNKTLLPPSSSSSVASHNPKKRKITKTAAPTVVQPPSEIASPDEDDVVIMPDVVNVKTEQFDEMEDCDEKYEICQEEIPDIKKEQDFDEEQYEKFVPEDTIVKSEPCSTEMQVINIPKEIPSASPVGVIPSEVCSNTPVQYFPRIQSETLDVINPMPTPYNFNLPPNYQNDPNS